MTSDEPSANESLAGRPYVLTISDLKYSYGETDGGTIANKRTSQGARSNSHAAAVSEISKSSKVFEVSEASVVGVQQRNLAIDNLSLSVKRSEIVSILGASGCGKSTLLNLISGLLTPSSGVITLNDSSARQKIGYIFQNDPLFPWRTVEANLLLSTELSEEISKESARSRIAQYLNTFHLSEQILKKYPAQLSGGMRQRVSIIQSLMFDPQLLLLDEPFSALDFFTKLRLESEFYDLVKTQNKAAILVTHDIEEAVAMSDRVLLMKKGGQLSAEFLIDFGPDRSPENARGTPLFAEKYNEIWSELKTVISE